MDYRTRQSISVTMLSLAFSPLIGACGAEFLCGPGVDQDVDVRACAEGKEIFRLSEHGGFGFCAHPTDLFSAIVVEDDNGTRTLCGTALVESLCWCPNRLDTSPYEGSCLVEIPANRWVLTSEEAATLDNLMDAVPEKTCSDDSLVTDWCIMRTYNFLDRRETGNCSSGDVNEEFSAAIGTLSSFVGDRLDYN